MVEESKEKTLLSIQESIAVLKSLEQALVFYYETLKINVKNHLKILEDSKNNIINNTDILTTKERTLVERARKNLKRTNNMDGSWVEMLDRIAPPPDLKRGEQEW